MRVDSQFSQFVSEALCPDAVESFAYVNVASQCHLLVVEAVSYLVRSRQRASIVKCPLWNPNWCVGM